MINQKKKTISLSYYILAMFYLKNKRLITINKMKKITSILLLLLTTVLITGISNIFSQSCPENLVSYWKMDETSGNKFVDLVNGNDATLHNFTVNPVTGKVDGANFFTYTAGISAGEGQYATAPDNAIYSFPANSGFTISYFLKFTETQYGLNGGQDHLIISKGDWNYGGPSTAFWASGVNGSGFISFMLRDDSHEKLDLEGRVYGQDNFDDNQWHHVACVRDGATDKCMIYVDGRITDQATVDFNSSFDNAAPIYIGSLTNTTPQYFYWGAIDELAIYNKALSKAEIDEIRANADLGTGLCNLIASPEINTTPGTKASVGSAYTYKVHAKGTQTDMIYSLITKPSGMTINSSTGDITWTPATVDVDGLVTIVANNGIAPADTQSYRIYISEGSGNCPTGLLALYRMDETSGSTYADVLGEHNATVPATYTGPTPTTGIMGGAQTFGAATRVDISPVGSEFDFAQNASFSFSSWFKTTSTGVAAMSRNRVDEGHVASWWIGVSPQGTGILELRDNAGTNTVLKGTTVINDGNWHLVVGVRDGVAGQNRVYVDGVLENTLNQTFVTDFACPNNLVVAIGYLTPWEGENQLHLIGDIDESAIFSRALTTQEIADYYNSGAPKGFCANQNYAPVITSTARTVATEDAFYSYSMTVDDINTTDTLTLTAPTKPSWLSFSWTPGSKTAVLSGTPTNDNVGSHNVVLRVSDNKSIRNQSFAIQVANSPDVPVITSTPVTSAWTTINYKYDITVTDVDVSDVINISVDPKPSWLTFNYTPGAKTATLTGIPQNANVGANPVIISVTDNHTTISQSFTIDVIQSNLAPAITTQLPLSVNKNSELLILKSYLTINDPDNSGDDLHIKVFAGSNYTFSGNTITPANNYVGLLYVNVRAYDLIDSSAIYQLIVNVTPVVVAPVVTSTPDTIAAVGNPYIYIFTTDKDNDPTYVKSALTKPSWLTYTSLGSILSGIPSAANIGKHQVVLQISDGTTSVYQVFNITVGTTGVTDLTQNSEYIIYPVPANNEINIKFNNLESETRVEIINSAGSIVESMMVPAYTDIATMPVNELKPGIYFCHVSNNSVNLTSRIIISK